MLSNYFLMASRHIAKNRFFIGVNLLGMALAIGCCTVAYYLHDFNDTFDQHHRNIQSIYRVSSFRLFQNATTKFGHAPLALGTALREDKGDFEKVVRYTTGPIQTRANGLVFADDVAFVDPEFFEFFTFDPAFGRLSLEDHSSMVISDDMAIKYFGKTDVIGEEILQLLDSGRTRPYTITGVFKRQPNNSSFGLQAYVNFENQAATSPRFDEHDWASRALVYAWISDPKRMATAELQLQKYVENNNLAREDFIISRYALEPMEGLAKHDSYNNTRGVWTNSAAHISAVVGTAAMGGFILLIACFNLTNTAIAVSARRLKEIGMRKVMGGSRGSIMAQYFSEVLLICLLSLVAGLFLAHYALIPAFNSLWSFWAFTPDYFGKPDFLVFISLILVVTSLLAGSYPALYVSKFQPIQILRNKVKFGGTNGFTLTLLALQLVISLIAVVCSMAFVANARYQQTLDMGFNRNEVLFTPVKNQLEFEALKSSLLQQPGVVSVAGSRHHIGSSFFNDPIKSAEQEIEVDILDIGEGYLETAGLTLLEGRNFIPQSASDIRESVIVTENLVKAFGWTEAIGQEITWMDTTRYRVVGVVRDIVNKGMMSRMDPVMLRYAAPQDARFCVVMATMDNVNEVKAFMDAEARRLFPDRISQVRYMNELVVNSLRINNNILKMFIFLGLAATLLSATGLYTLTSLNVARRMKEIGVRKVLGASAGNITRIINKQLFIILGIAIVAGGYFGASLAGLLLDSIWEHFERTTWQTLTYASLIILLTAAGSVAYKIFTTVRINPITILRSE